MSTSRAPGVNQNGIHVFVFPAVTSYHRFLIHQVIEEYPQLASFSIGQGDNRRTVICPHHLRARDPFQVANSRKRGLETEPQAGSGGTCSAKTWKEEDRETGDGSSWSLFRREWREERSKKAEEEKMASSQDAVGSDGGTPRSKDKNRKSKRAPQELYVPRAQRHHLPTAESVQNSRKATEAVDTPEGDQPGDTSSGMKQQPRKNEKRKGREGGKGKQQRDRRTSTDGEEGEGMEAKEKKTQNRGKHGRRGDQQRYVPRPQRDDNKSRKSSSEEGDTLPVRKSRYSEHSGDTQRSGADKCGSGKQVSSAQSAVSLNNASPVPEDWNEIDCDDRDVTCYPTGTRLTSHGKLIPVDPADSASLQTPPAEMEFGTKYTTTSESIVSLGSPQNNESNETKGNTNPKPERCSSDTNKHVIEADDDYATDGNKSEIQDGSSVEESQDAVKENTSALCVSNIQKDCIETEDITTDDAVCRTSKDSATLEQKKSVNKSNHFQVLADENSRETLAMDKAVTRGNSTDQDMDASVITSTEDIGALSLNQEHPARATFPPSSVHTSGVDADEPQSVLFRDDLDICETTESKPDEEESGSPTHNQQTEDETCTEESGNVESAPEVPTLYEEKRNDARNKDDDDDDDWDAMFDESGDCLKQEEIEELTEGVGNVQVSVKQSKRDYYNYQPKDSTDYSELEHVIEVFEFPVDFKTQDLIMGFSNMKTKEMDIKWVDDTHALAIFPSSVVAQDALGISNPMFRTRPLLLASREAKMKARGCQEFLLPSKPRPETSAATARRLVSGALGLKSSVSKEQKAAERQKIKDAKDRRRSDKKQQEDIWDGNI